MPIRVPPPKHSRTPNKVFAEVAKATSREVGRAWVSAPALGTVVLWAITGPFFQASQPRAGEETGVPFLGNSPGQVA
jgi:hypothetical protein